MKKAKRKARSDATSLVGPFSLKIAQIRQDHWQGKLWESQAGAAYLHEPASGHQNTCEGKNK
jgi:hypothetical protein